MPFRSKAQMRMAFAGAIPEISKDRAKQWLRETVDPDDLPERVEKKTAALFAEVLKVATLGNQATSDSSHVGKFQGMATQHSLKAPGMESSATAINPRRGISSAINTFKA